MKLERALPIIRQLIDGIEAAHEKNIVHRDLKPANIKITSAGVVKILDFGLARTADGARDEGNAENSPTITIGSTQAGTILGTASYMSPEQAKGKTATRRSDIWSFGVVVYELLTGKRAFDGETVVETLGAVLNKDPDWTIVPAQAQRLLRRSIEREPSRRLGAIGDARWMLEEGLNAPAPQTVPAPSRFRNAGWIVAGVCALAAVGLGALPWAPWRAAPEPPKVVRFQIDAPAKVSLTPGFALSPDGSKLAYEATGADGALKIWLRSMDTLEPRALPGTEVGGFVPIFWSYDSRFVLFNADGKLKKVDVAGGPPQTLCDAPAVVLSGSSNRDGVIVYGLNSNAGIQRVSAAGGKPSAVTAANPARKDSIHGFPVFLPDGKHFLYLVLSAVAENTGIYLGSLDAKPDQQDSRLLVATSNGPVFVPLPGGKTGEILFLRDGTLLGQAFDLHTLNVVGEAVPVAEQVGNYLSLGSFSASDSGVLVYRSGSAEGKQLTWLDRDGKSTGTVGSPHAFGELSLSPDATRVAFRMADATNNDIWLASVAHGGETRFTFDPAPDAYPVWSPDGNWVAFSSRRASNFDLYRHASNGAGEDQLLLKSDLRKYSTDWSRDGRYLLYMQFDPQMQQDLWVLPMEGSEAERKPILFLSTPFSESNAKFSPDGHWIAYQSNESGISQIYVKPFPAPAGGGGKWMVSQGGGQDPHWRGDGKELLYMSFDGTLMSVSVSANGGAFSSQPPKPLFRRPGGVGNTLDWDVAPNGQKFLFPLPATDSQQSSFTVVQNWMSLLKR